jgi:hypothetical protein
MYILFLASSLKLRPLHCFLPQLVDVYPLLQPVIPYVLPVMPSSFAPPKPVSRLNETNQKQIQTSQLEEDFVFFQKTRTLGD